MQLAGGLAALRIFMNCPAGGVRRVAGDLCGRQGFAVAHRDMRAERDGNQMIGDCAIQIVFVGKALVLQTEILHRAAVATIQEPFGVSAACLASRSRMSEIEWTSV